MAGSLIKIDEEIVTSAVATVTLTGIDSTYDVYMVKYNNVQPETDIQNLNVRFTVSGTADSSSNYDYAFKKLRTDIAFNTLTATNQDKLRTSATPTGTSASEVNNGLMYLFNFNNASEYSFITEEETMRSYTGLLIGNQGGGVLTVAQACDGIQFFFESGNIDSAVFTLYGLKK
jgi:hypothetical protein